MRITITIANPDVLGSEDQDLVSLEVFPDMTVATLKGSIQAEKRIDGSKQHLYHNGDLIEDNSKTLEQLGVADNDMLALHVRDMRRGPSAGARSGAGQPATGGSGDRGGISRQPDPELIRLQLLGNPEQRAALQRSNPAIAAALDDPAQFAQMMTQNYDRERRDRAERQRQIQALNADPFDVEAQAKIEEMIRQERVMENLQNAMEHNPEVFGYVHMLYVDVEVNGHRVKALVDSGAQTTIMSPATAEACGIMRLVDKRFSGVAKGVGEANIIGRVHTAPIKIGSLFLPCSFTVMEGKNVDMLLGLDMLKCHQVTLDMARDRMIIQGVEVPFLGEADIPKQTEAAIAEERQLAGPGGFTIGSRSGTVQLPSEPPEQKASPSSKHPGSSTATSGASSAAAAQARAAPSFPREHIEQLMQLGASEDKAQRALEATGGNVEFAAGLIFDD